MVGYDHGIANWQLVFVTDHLRKQKILASLSDHSGFHADALAVLCVNPEAWNSPHPNLWEKAEFEARSHYLDDMFEIGRGNKTLQRDRAMRSVGMAAGALCSKAQSLGYVVDHLHDVDISLVGREIGVPASHQIEYVFCLGHHSNHIAPTSIAQRGRKCVSLEQFSEQLLD